MERIGSYAVIAELGSGATSRVLLGQRDDEAEVRVLKQLRMELTSDSVARMRFQREALLASRLDHPHIAKICWSGVEAGHFCIAMEFVAGKTLAAITQRMPKEIAIPIALEILSGLAYAHELTDGAGQPLSIVHRDLSADNVMVGYDGLVKIIDFGTARARVDDFRTSPGVRVGTLLYMSPEQSNSQPVDHRSDLYTVAVLIWELLTGRRLVEARNPIDIMEEISYRVATPAHEIDPAISEELSAVIARGLAKDPEHRWQSAREFGEALRAEAGPCAGTEEIGRFMRESFPDGAANATAAIELARKRYVQDHEETIPEDPRPSPDSTLYLDTVSPREPSSGLRLPKERDPQKISMWMTAIVLIALMVGFTLGLVTERAGWWRQPPPGGSNLQQSSPR